MMAPTISPVAELLFDAVLGAASAVVTGEAASDVVDGDGCAVVGAPVAGGVVVAAIVDGVAACPTRVRPAPSNVSVSGAETVQVPVRVTPVPVNAVPMPSNVQLLVPLLRTVNSSRPSSSSTTGPENVPRDTTIVMMALPFASAETATAARSVKPGADDPEHPAKLSTPTVCVPEGRSRCSCPTRTGVAAPARLDHVSTATSTMDT